MERPNVVVIVLDISAQLADDEEVSVSPIAWVMAGAVILSGFTVRPMLRGINASVDAALGPLGLERSFGTITGKRDGRKVKVAFTPDETTTEVDSVTIVRRGSDACEWLRDLLEAERQARAS